MEPDRYDLVVIGAGPAGENGAAQAAYYGKRVAIVEARDVPGGGPGTRTGVPTKTSQDYCNEKGNRLPRFSDPPCVEAQVGGNREVDLGIGQ